MEVEKLDLLSLEIVIGEKDKADEMQQILLSYIYNVSTLRNRATWIQIYIW